jgi:hypothetical protein
MHASQADKEVHGNKAKSDLYAVPSYQRIVRYLPRVKAALGPSTTWHATFLKMKMLGLRYNLGGIEIRDDDGHRFDPAVGDPIRDDWYKSRTGEIYTLPIKSVTSEIGPFA